MLPCRLTRRGLASLLLGTAAATALAAHPARAALPPGDQEFVSRIEAYFNSLTTLAASFQQTAADGSVSTGKLYIDRGRGAMRFDYDPPSKILLVAPGDWRLIFYDGSIKQVNVIPLIETPLGFMLKDKVSLEGDVAVVGVATRPDEIDLTVVRSKQPDQGNVVMTFSKQPLALRRWTVTDAQGVVTRVALGSTQVGVPLDRNLFVWRDPKLFGWPED
jgi:outer membrane lipoprotein-sorting protein